MPRGFPPYGSNPVSTKPPPHVSQTTHTPDIRNTTMPPHTGQGRSELDLVARRNSSLSDANGRLSALRRGARSRSCARCGHDPDGSHPDRGLHSALQKQVCVLPTTRRQINTYGRQNLL